MARRSRPPLLTHYDKAGSLGGVIQPTSRGALGCDGARAALLGGVPTGF